MQKKNTLSSKVLKIIEQPSSKNHKRKTLDEYKCKIIARKVLNLNQVKSVR